MTKSELTQYIFSSDELTEYLDYVTKKSSNPVSNIHTLTSQIRVDGLASLSERFAQDSSPTINELQQNYEKKLLQDLHRHSKITGFGRELRMLPQFNQEFYNEIQKPSGERSEEYQNFIKTYADLTPASHAVESISAKALQDLNNPDMTPETLYTNMVENQTKYGKKYSNQAEKDLNRSTIKLKGSDGKTTAITFEELRDSNLLTGEQKEFIISSWQQGTFNSGWIAANRVECEIDGIFQRATTVSGNNRNDILIEVSDDKVMVYNRVKVELAGMHIDETDVLKTHDYIEAAVAVDISEMNADRFVFGAASSKPKIKFEINELNPEIAFQIPEFMEYETRLISEKNNSISDMVNKSSLEGTISAMKKGINPHTETKYLKSQMTNAEFIEFISQVDSSSLSENWRKQLIEEVNSKPTSPEMAGEQVQLNNWLETNIGRKKEFAIDKLDQYLSTCNPKRLDDKEMNRIVQAVDKIMTPIAKNPDEAKFFKEKINKVVRKAASESDASMSISQRFKHICDKIKDTFKKIFNKTIKYEKIMDSNPELLGSLKKHSSNMPKSHKIISNRKDQGFERI